MICKREDKNISGSLKWWEKSCKIEMMIMNSNNFLKINKWIILTHRDLIKINFNIKELWRLSQIKFWRSKYHSQCMMLLRYRSMVGLLISTRMKAMWAMLPPTMITRGLFREARTLLSTTCHHRFYKMTWLFIKVAILGLQMTTWLLEVALRCTMVRQMTMI